MLDEDTAVHSSVEKIVDLCSAEHSLAVLARRHDCSFNPHPSQILDEGDGTGIRIDTRSREDLIDQVVFSVAETADGLSSRRIVLGAFGQVDAARFQEIAHPVVSRLSIYIKFVVDGDIKRSKWDGVSRRPLL